MFEMLVFGWFWVLAPLVAKPIQKNKKYITPLPLVPLFKLTPPPLVPVLLLFSENCDARFYVCVGGGGGTGGGEPPRPATKGRQLKHRASNITTNVPRTKVPAKTRCGESVHANDMRRRRRRQHDEAQQRRRTTRTPIYHEGAV